MRPRGSNGVDDSGAGLSLPKGACDLVDVRAEPFAAEGPLLRWRRQFQVAAIAE